MPTICPRSATTPTVSATIPRYVAALRSSIAKIAASPCDIIITPNPPASHVLERFALGKPCSMRQGCKAYAASVTAELDERLAKEKAKK